MWRLEEDYWRYVQAGDIESYVQLWHEDFVNWPCHSKTPSDKSGIGNWVREIRDNRWQIITGMCAAQEPVVAPRS